VIGFGFASHWLKNWRKILKPTKRSAHNSCLISFKSQLKSALKLLAGKSNTDKDHHPIKHITQIAILNGSHSFE